MNASIWFKSFFLSKNNLEFNDNQKKSENHIVSDKVTYNENLINNLKEDHQHLLSLYGALLQSSQRFQYAQILEKLQIFEKSFKIYLYSKNVKLYAYLEQNLKEEVEEFKKMRKFRREMRVFETKINQFFTAWIGLDLNSQNIQEFTDALKEIGHVLVKRLESEESLLHPIYNKVA